MNTLNNLNFSSGRYVKLGQGFTEKLTEMVKFSLRIFQQSNKAKTICFLAIYWKDSDGKVKNSVLVDNAKNFSISDKQLQKLANSRSDSLVEIVDDYKEKLIFTTITPRFEFTNLRYSKNAKKNSPRFCHINIISRSDIPLDTMRWYLEANTNDLYISTILDVIVKVMSSNNNISNSSDPVMAFELVLLEIQNNIPDIDFVFWEYDDDFPVLAEQLATFESTSSDIFPESLALWSAYTERKTIEIKDISKISEHDFDRESLDLLRSMSTQSKWKSAYIETITINGRNSGLLGFFCGYNSDLALSYAPLITFVRQQSKTAILEKSHLIKDASTRSKMKKLAPLLAIGRESNQRMHDIRDHVNSINEELKYIADPKNEDLKRIKKSAISAVYSIENIKTVLSKQLNKFKKARESTRKTEINKYIESIQDDLKFEANFDGVEVTYILGKIPTYVKLQRFYFQRVLENLISNATYFARLNSYARKPVVTLKVDARKDSLIISITDSGDGIRQIPIDIIFEEGESTKVDGHGIGLSIVKSVIEDHGGKVFAENSIDGTFGAKFSISLPIYKNN